MKLRWCNGLAAPLALLASGLLAQACGDSIPESNVRGTGGPAAPAAAPAAASEKKEREPLMLKDEDFVQSIKNRDPFHSYSLTFRARAPESSQRRVIMPTVPVEEMRLIAIVS